MSNSNLPTPKNPDLEVLIESFKYLSQITNPVLFPIEFEGLQKASGLRLSTFKAAWKAWLSQRKETGGNA